MEQDNSSELDRGKVTWDLRGHDIDFGFLSSAMGRQCGSLIDGPWRQPHPSLGTDHII